MRASLACCAVRAAARGIDCRFGSGYDDRVALVSGGTVMALINGPQCRLPLTEAEPRRAHCSICGAALIEPAPASAVPPPAAPSSGRRGWPRVALGTATALVLVLLLLWWT